MPADVDATPEEPGALVLVDTERSRPVPVRCGAELVALSERFYGGVFVGGVVFVGLASLAALVLLPFRYGAGSYGPSTPAVVATGVVLAATPFAVWRAAVVYRTLRRRRSVEVGLLVVAALLVAYPMRSQLWWPSCAILMAIAIVVPFRRALAYCLVVLAVSFASHAVGGDLHELSAEAIIGLCIGYSFWTAAVAMCSDRLAAYLLRLHATASSRRPAPRNVAAWTTSLSSDPGPAAPGPNAAHHTNAAMSGVALPIASSTAPAPRGETRVIVGQDPATRADDAPKISRLTARQLQVVALLADGLRYREVAACLSISQRQVQRHVTQAATRLGVNTAYELVAVAVSEGMVPDHQRSRDSRRSSST